ncbi:MAG: hypothetical protein J5534_07940 [Fibrobacter sp.]|nr:hypothetical protein [Fibrobacter sp.]
MKATNFVLFIYAMTSLAFATDTCIGRNSNGDCIKLFTEIAPNDYHWITTCADQNPETPLSECKNKIESNSLGDMAQLQCIDGPSVDKCRSLKKKQFANINGKLELRITTTTTCISPGDVNTCDRFLVETNMNGKTFSKVYER